MTTRQKRAIGNQILVIATALGLKGWTWNLSSDPSREGTIATVSATYGRRDATLWFSPDWWHHAADERHYALIHEIVHVVTGGLREYLDETLPQLLGGPTWAAVEQAIRQNDEHATDQLATALAPFIPVMEDPK